MTTRLNLPGLLLLAAWLVLAGPGAAAWAAPAGPSYPIVDTGQHTCYDNWSAIACPKKGQAFYGQDAQFQGAQPSYRDNGDGTVTDLVTGLMWVKARGEKMSWEQAMAGARSCRVGGFHDWRAPTIKELYSLINFSGNTMPTAAAAKPYLDTRFFDFRYGNTRMGERVIDCQDWSATEYLGTTMGGNPTAFGVNFADGRIKGYPKSIGPGHRQARPHYMRYVRGNPAYGRNKFHDNGDGTVTDAATSLTWQKGDSGQGLDWQQALAYAAGLRLAGRSDWRLPNAKELQSIVDYTRRPAIAPVFELSDPAAYFWTSTTHLEGGRASAAVYIAFGPALGYWRQPWSRGEVRLMDVHGAGAQRSDPKSGDPARFPYGRGPQGDDIRIYNYVRCVRGGQALPVTPPPPAAGEGAFQGQAPPPGQGQPFGRGSGGGRGPGMRGPGPGGRRGPPPEAYRACRGRAEGSPCSFNVPLGLVEGRCGQVPQGFVCVPAGRGGGMAGQGGMGPGFGRRP